MHFSTTEIFIEYSGALTILKLIGKIFVEIIDNYFVSLPSLFRYDQKHISKKINSYLVQSRHWGILEKCLRNAHFIQTLTHNFLWNIADNILGGSLDGTS